MIKCLAIVISFFVSLPAFTQAFYKMLDVPDTSQFDSVQIDASYTLYVKRICKKIINNITEPCNCLELPNFAQEDVVEYEYLFLSRKHERVIVVNYIKDRDQKFYTQPAPNLLESKSSIKEVEVNIWYFNQMRFGRYDTAKSIGRFRTTFKPYDIHRWKIDTNSDTLKISSVSVEKADGLDERITRISMALVPAFTRVDQYKIIYQQPPDNSKYDAHPLPNNTMYVDTKEGCIFFIFNEDISEGRRTIKFKSNRRYSYFPLKSTTDE